MTEDDFTKRRLRKEYTTRPIRGAYKSGATFNCRIVLREPRGYLVSVGLHEDPGFMPTNSEFDIDSWVSAQFVCISNGQVLVSAKHQQK